MKRLAIVVMLVCGLAQAINDYTADECRSKGKVGEKIKLRVAYLSARTDGGAGIKEGYTFMLACTHDGTNYGDWIDVAIPTKNVEYYLRRTGTKLRYVGTSDKVAIFEARGIIRSIDLVGGGRLMYVELTPPSSVK